MSWGEWSLVRNRFVSTRRLQSNRFEPDNTPLNYDKLDQLPVDSEKKEKKRHKDDMLIFSTVAFIGEEEEEEEEESLQTMTWSPLSVRAFHILYI